MDDSPVTTVNSLLQFFIYVALVFICIKRRQRGNFPLLLVVASWLMLLLSLDTIISMALGPEFIGKQLGRFLPEASIKNSYSMFDLSMLLNFAKAIAFLLLSIGIFQLARTRILETRIASNHQPPTS